MLLPENDRAIGRWGSLAAVTGLPVVSDLRSMDLARWAGRTHCTHWREITLVDYDLFLNLGGIANLTAGERVSASGAWQAFDVCPANRVLT
jgi:anhydro-N-acetylmuramic acid kinase